MTLGQGTPLFCLHAFPTSSFDYSRVAPLLAGQFRLILFDYPGFGFSDKPHDYRYSLFEYAEALSTVADHWGVSSAPLIAHDIGDSVALEVVRRGVPHVEKLILMNGSVLSIPFDDWRMRLRQRALLHRFVGPLITKLGLINKRTFTGMMNGLFATPLSPAEVDDFWSLVTCHDGVAIYHRLMRYMPERWEHQTQWLDALEHHTAPLTLIWGMADPVATPDVAEEVVRRRPDARYVKLDGIGHYPHWETPERVARVIQEALSG